jgi:N utilization substance protein B
MSDAESSEGGAPFQQELLFDADAPDAVVSRSVLDTVLDPETVVEHIDVEPPPSLRPVAGGRHEARERAVHLLYEAAAKGQVGAEVLGSQVLAADEYTEALVRGVGEHLEELDEIISRLARGWTIARMPTLDVVVLRVACFELAHRPDVPRGVVLSEAVDLAGRYGTDESSRFVNGLLAAAADELRPA